jgi:phosphoribosyl-ATP pyrophosphohydrolase
MRNKITIDMLYDIVESRKSNPVSGSYVSSLFNEGLDRIAQKVGEEAIETVIAAKNRSKKRLVSELADLWFHSIVLMCGKGISVDEIYCELEKRNKK